MADDASIRILPLDGTWETLGSDRLRGIVPQGIEASSDSWGPSDMRFTLAAERGARRPDILPFTPVELEVGGLFSWSGFVWQRPSDQNNYSVSCRGWQFHLDDDLYDRVYVQTRLTDWVDGRSFLSTDLTARTAGWQVNNGEGQIVLALPTGVTAPAAASTSAIYDAGPDSTIKKVKITVKGGGAANLTFFIRGASTVPTAADESTTIVVPVPTVDTTYTVTFTTARRYVELLFANTSGGVLTGLDTSWMRISIALLVRDAAYEAFGASILKADDVIRDALSFAPLLSQDQSLITDTTFSLPSFSTNGYVTPKTAMEAANLVEFNRLKIGGEDLKRLVYDPKPDAPIAEVGDWSGSQFDDATVTGEPIYNRAIIDGTGPDGARLVSKRTQTGDFVTRRGFTRSARVDVSAAGTAAVFDRINDLWLTEHKTAPFSGTLTIVGSGARRILSGGSIPPHEFLLYSGEKVRLANRVDPDTGDWGRDGRIAGSTYRHDDRAVVISIDNQPHRWDEVLARYAALVGG